jgi:hypothetical protein
MNTPSPRRPNDQDRPDHPSPHDAPGIGRTQAGKGGTVAPRLPHERDESSDSQTPANASAQRVGRQAHADLAAGQQDTDRRQETLDELNERTMPRSDPAAGQPPPGRARRT